MKITEANIKDFFGQEVYIADSDEIVLLKGYRGNGLAQISHRELFRKGKYPNITHDCLITKLHTLD